MDTPSQQWMQTLRISLAFSRMDQQPRYSSGNQSGKLFSPPGRIVISGRAHSEMKMMCAHHGASYSIFLACKQKVLWQEKEKKNGCVGSWTV